MLANPGKGGRQAHLELHPYFPIPPPPAPNRNPNQYQLKSARQNVVQCLSEIGGLEACCSTFPNAGTVTLAKTGSKAATGETAIQGKGSDLTFEKQMF